MKNYMAKIFCYFNGHTWAIGLKREVCTVCGLTNYYFPPNQPRG